MKRPTAEDLYRAAEWCDCYEDTPGLEAVVAFLDREARKARQREFMDQCKKEFGFTTAQARTAWKRLLAETASAVTCPPGRLPAP